MMQLEGFVEESTHFADPEDCLASWLMRTESFMQITSRVSIAPNNDMSSCSVRS
jgi:hypothetical protein